MEFRQIDFNLDRFVFTIEETGIRMVRKRLSVSTETFVDFENVGTKIIREKSRKLLWIVLSILFLFFAIVVFIKRLNGGKVGDGAEFIHLGLSLVLFMIYVMTKKNLLFLTQPDNTNAIEFIETKRYKYRLDAFIKTLLQKRNEYLVDKYASLDPFLPYNQQYNNLVWLYNLELLEREQLQLKIAELDKMEAGNLNPRKNELTKIIGFRGKENNDNDDHEEDDDE